MFIQSPSSGLRFYKIFSGKSSFFYSLLFLTLLKVFQ